MRKKIIRNSNYKRSKNYDPDYTTRYGYSGKPEGDIEVKDHISIKATKDLPKSSYAIKSDPYEAALSTSEPYPILNRFNKKVGGNYSGDDNIDGGNVQQYANSTTSKFLKYFDIIRTKINANYRFLPINDDTYGSALVDEMRKSIAEAVSILKSTTFTQMAINNFAVETNLPMGSAETDNIANGEGNDIQAYTDLTDVLYCMSIYYQIFLQDSLNVMNWHNSFRMKQGVAIKNAWNREVPSLNSFFGLMNKKAFLSLLQSINLSYEGEYVDKDFMQQMNILTLIPSRRSNSITDPVLELQCGFNHPTIFKIYEINPQTGKIVDPGNKPFFDDADLKASILFEHDDPEVVTYWEACDHLRDYLSLEATQLWARQTLTPASISGSDNSRYNKIKALFDVIIASMTIFKPIWSDFREALDVMARTGTLSWSKGFVPSITKDTDGALFQNMIVDDIFKHIYSGSAEVVYDSSTKRWRTFSLWNMYNGIPSYDERNGGSFLTLSFKKFVETDPNDNEQIEYLPLLFDATGNNPDAQVICVACSRDGKEAKINYSSVVMDSEPVLSRLAPLTSQVTLKIRVPVVNATINPSLTRAHYSTLYKTLTQIFGLCSISLDGTKFDIALDPDILAIYQIEISDITNYAITYARANAPFRGTSSTDDKLGFKSAVSGDK